MKTKWKTTVLRQEAQFAFSWRQVSKWFQGRVELKEFISSRRLGLKGIRPFGSTKALTHFGHEGQGARIPRTDPAENKKIPLGQLFIKVKKWFENERTHNTEVKRMNILQRVKYQMEFDRDRHYNISIIIKISRHIIIYYDILIIITIPIITYYNILLYIIL